MKTLRDYIPDAKWHSWKALPRREKALLIAAYVCDHLKPREDKGRNRGEIVDAITRQAGYEPSSGFAWCGMFVTACVTLAGYRKIAGEIPSMSPGAVIRWVQWAKASNRLAQKPERGDLAYWLNPNQTGHIGFVVRVLPLGFILTIEGNTSSGEAGSQRDGDGAYRRIRRRKTWHGFIRLAD